MNRIGNGEEEIKNKNKVYTQQDNKVEVEGGDGSRRRSEPHQLLYSLSAVSIIYIYMLDVYRENQSQTTIAVTIAAAPVGDALPANSGSF